MNICQSLARQIFLCNQALLCWNNIQRQIQVTWSSPFLLYFGILMVKNYCWPENRAEELQNSSQYNPIYALLQKFLRAVRYCYDIQLSCSIYTWLLPSLKYMQEHSQRHLSWIYNFLGKAQLNSSSSIEMLVSFARLCINIKHKD